MTSAAANVISVPSVIIIATQCILQALDIISEVGDLLTLKYARRPPPEFSEKDDDFVSRYAVYTVYHMKHVEVFVSFNFVLGELKVSQCIGFMCCIYSYSLGLLH